MDFFNDQTLKNKNSTQAIIPRTNTKLYIVVQGLFYFAAPLVETYILSYHIIPTKKPLYLLSKTKYFCRKKIKSNHHSTSWTLLKMQFVHSKNTIWKIMIISAVNSTSVFIYCSIVLFSKYWYWVHNQFFIWIFLQFLCYFKTIIQELGKNAHSTIKPCHRSLL